jgi:hypothetical protein
MSRSSIGRDGPLTAADLRAIRAELLAQLEHEPAVLDALEAAGRSGDATTGLEILAHLRDLFTLLTEWVRLTKVGDNPPPLDPAA